MKHGESDVERQISIQCIHFSDLGNICGKEKEVLNSTLFIPKKL